MKKISLFIASLMLAFSTARADEGMWLLKLMEMQHLKDSLRKAGLRMPAKELYSETAPSLRECVGMFGGGCTGEIVSADGLVLTNNHCGFGFVHAMSTMEHNYLQDGYFAKSRAEELPVPNLTFTFVQRVEEVTEAVDAAANKAKVDEYTKQSQHFLEGVAKQLLEKSEYAGKAGMNARLLPYFGGNKFFIFYEQTYSDVRLVVNPPQNIAQFGFNQDNWLWPRHNADFAAFRIYADKDGQPAAYAAENVPLKCKRHLSISLRGIDEDDYTMIMGCPGSTSRYLTASEVNLRTGSINAPISLAGDAQLIHMKQRMDSDSVMNLKLADEYMSLGNVVKNYGGMNESVKKTKLLDIKQREEAAFRKFAQKSLELCYAFVIVLIDSLMTVIADTLHDRNLMNRTIGAIWSIKGIGAEYDREVVELLIPYWKKYARLDYSRNPVLSHPEAYIDSICDRTFLSKLLREADAQYFTDAIKRYRAKRAELDKIYTRGLCEMYNWGKAPDANLTLRMTYGGVKSYEPRDGVHYHWQTMLDGMFEKENPADPDYVINEKLRSFFDAGNFGRYARKDGKLPVCFITNNDITGGNSGSPVLNAKGELIGLAFDGNIESLSSDLRYNPALQRCICVDIRYVLFLIDTYGGSTYLLDELTIKK